MNPVRSKKLKIFADLFAGRTSNGMKVFVGLSGGVDSAVSAALLQQAGHDVTGVFIRIALAGYPCTAGEDKRDAMRVAAHLRIPFLEVDLSEEYAQKVFDTSIAEFKKGNTPNPDALCNREIKFGLFFDWCKIRGADAVATGHYARVAKSTDYGHAYFSAEKSAEALAPSSSRLPPSVILLCGLDSEKDQSYFLWAVPEAVLQHTLFPVGDKTKKDVRALAKKFGLPNAERKDSQGLCFLGPVSLEEMLARELSPKPGEVLDEAGAVVGGHDGAELYTLGERRGFKLFLHPPAGGSETSPHFVIAKDVEKNTITVSTSRFPQNAQKTKITLRETNWIGEYKGGPCTARFRYRQKLIPALLQRVPLKNGSQGEPLVVLLEPHYVPHGQSLVLYDGDRCLGGGIIDRVEYE